MLDPRQLSQFPFLAELSVAGRFRLLSATLCNATALCQSHRTRGIRLRRPISLKLVPCGFTTSAQRDARGRSIGSIPVNLALSPSIASWLDCLIRPGSRQIRPRPRSRSYPGTCTANCTLQSLLSLHVRHSLNSALGTDDAAAGDRIVWSRTTCCSVSSKTLGKRSRLGNNTRTGRARPWIFPRSGLKGSPQPGKKRRDQTFAGVRRDFGR